MHFLKLYLIPKKIFETASKLKKKNSFNKINKMTAIPIVG